MKEDLKTVLFIEVVTALEAYQAAIATRFPSPEAKRRQERFAAVWAIVEKAGLEDEFQIWKEG